MATCAIHHILVTFGELFMPMKYIPLYCLTLCVFCLGCNVPGELKNTTEIVVYQCDAEVVDHSGEQKVFVGGNTTFSRGDMQSDEESRSGSFSCKLSKGNETGMSCSLNNLVPGEYVEVSIWQYGEGNHGSLVLSGDKSYYQKVFVPIVEESSGWKKLSYNLTVMEPFDKLTVYGYNADTAPAFYDDLLVRRSSSRPVYYEDSTAIEINIPEATVAVLDSFRLVALNNGVIDNSLKVYFDAMLVQGENTIPVKLRLKGDWTDHLEGDKWSFRIKVKDGFSFNGLKSFSIQSPHTRSYLEEYVAHKLFEREDVLTTRYDFLPVKLNGKNLGIFAIEEHFDKQLVESRNRREGPIVKLDEDGHWEKKLYDLSGGKNVHIPVYQAAAVLPFKKKRTASSKALLGQFEIAQNLMTQYKNHSESSGDLLDLELMAKYYALLDICRIHHAIHWHNHRFYYNPITSRLEPIAFDCHAEPLRNIVRLPICGYKHVHGWKNPSYDNLLFYHVANDFTFQKYYASYLKKYSSITYLDSFFGDIQDDLQERERMLGKEYGGYKFDPLAYTQAAKNIREELPNYERSCEDGFIGFRGSAPSYKSPLPDSVYFEQTGLKAYLSRTNDSTSVVQLINYSLSKIEIQGYSIAPFNDSLIPLPSPTLLQGYSGEVDPVKLDLPGYVTRLWFKPKNGEFDLKSKKVLPWPFPNTKNPRKELEGPILGGGKYWTISDSIITFRKKLYVNRILFIPKGYQVRVLPGTNIIFGSGGGILSYSSITATGNKQSPITVVAKYTNNHGFQVLSPNKKSLLKWVEFDGMNTLNYKNWCLTGGVTFYNTEVELSNCSFLNGISEDAINLVRCDFTMASSTVNECLHDGFDADFCNGIVEYSNFQNAGNDGLDFSGSTVRVINCELKHIGDKGISGGEASEVTVAGCNVKTAEMALVSKDNSTIVVSDTKIENCTIVYAAYQKKDEFGPATIRSVDCPISEYENEFLLDLNSKLHLNGSLRVGVVPISIDSLYF